MSAAPGRRLTAVIVDDEPPARRTLQLLLAHEPDIDVVAECGDGATAVRAILDRQPDLVFLDIQIPGGDGFDVLRQLAPDRRPVVGFVTAYDQYALQAFDAHAVDYLLKPFADERFTAMVDRMRQAVRLKRVDELERRLTALVDATAPASVIHGHGATPSQLVVRDGRRTLVLPLTEIVWIEAEDYYVRIHAGARQPLVRRSLQSLADELETDGFTRVHRSAVVNLRHVREVRAAAKTDYEVVLSTGDVVRLSRSLKDALTSRLHRS